MTKEQIIKRLLELPHLIKDAEDELTSWQISVSVAKNKLADMEAKLLLGDQINGKNAEQRQAQLRVLTEHERKEVEQAEKELAMQRTIYNRLQNEFKALRSIAQIIGAEVE